MSTPSGVDSGEDLDNVPLGRLSEAQPSGDSSASPAANSDKKSSASCEYSAENTDSNGDSASARSEGAAGTEETDEDDGDSDSGEMIVPEFVPDELPMDIPKESQDRKASQSVSWPTLEILPGGVIKRGEVNDEDDGDPTPANQQENDPMGEAEELMYACAKCPERFKLLFSLVKHVRWHEDERRKQQGVDLSKLSRLEKELITIKRTRFEVEQKYKKQKTEVMSRIADAIGQLGDLSEIFN